MSEYFSHFGSVATPAKPNRKLVLMARALNKAHEATQQNWLTHAERCHVQEPALAWKVRIPQGWQDFGNNLTARAHILGDQAVLTVSADYGDWLSVGVVNWPLEFEGPAMIAAACCAPRYGVGKDS